MVSGFLRGINIVWTRNNVGLYVYRLSFISILVFSLYFYLGDSSPVGCDIVRQLIFDHIQTLCFSYYQCHKSHYTSYNPAEGVIVL